MRVDDVAGKLWVGRTRELAAAGGGDAHGVAAAAHQADALAQARVHHLGGREQGGELAREQVVQLAHSAGSRRAVPCCLNVSSFLAL